MKSYSRNYRFSSPVRRFLIDRIHPLIPWPQGLGCGLTGYFGMELILHPRPVSWLLLLLGLFIAWAGFYSQHLYWKEVMMEYSRD